MLQMLLLTLVALIALFAIYVALQPAGFRISRSTTIAAPPEAVFAHVDTLARWDAWSPWAKRDPKATTTFDGPAHGPGASFGWSGNSEVGEGKMTIVESEPAKSIRIRLDLVRPVAVKRDVAFDFEPMGDGTQVTWSIAGQQGFVERAMCTVMRLDLDRMIGGDYEAGLAALKKIVEAR